MSNLKPQKDKRIDEVNRKKNSIGELKICGTIMKKPHVTQDSPSAMKLKCRELPKGKEKEKKLEKAVTVMVFTTL